MDCVPPPGCQIQDGVLLYYKFVTIPHPQHLKDWFLSLCSSLSILGRIRVAPDGVNVTVGGTMDSLKKHVNAVNSHPLLRGCDFKLASCLNPMNHKIAAECGFSSLSVRLVKELVSLCINPSIQPPSISEAGKHLSAIEFHKRLEEAASSKKSFSFSLAAELDEVHSCFGDGQAILNILDETDTFSLQETKQVWEPIEHCITCRVAAEESATSSKQAKVVVMDARNVYETLIGRFFPPPGVEFLQPNIRQYSDLPAWIDANVNLFRNRCILMYCTGGVRCEMASSYLKSKGEGFNDVYQLFGGIQRYLEAFPQGGFFRGKNFVFDPRVAVPSYNSEVIGSCMVCGVAFDDYSLRCRCSHCRMLVLVCSSCQGAGASNLDGLVYTCELCKVNGKVEDLAQTHQSASDCLTAFEPKGGARMEAGTLALARPKLRILCLHGFRQNASNLKGRLASFTKKLKQVAEFVFVNAPHEVPLISKTHLEKGNENAETEIVGPLKAPKIHKKYAWLISPEMMASKSSSSSSSINMHEQDSFCVENLEDQLDTAHLRTTGFGQMQYKKQTAGWSESYTYLQNIFSELGPFDGILGFSQGAAIAAALSALRKSINSQEESVDFKFAILCSGFLSPAQEHQQWASSCTSQFDCPSLHIFGGIEGCDRQISTEASMQLASLFQSNCRNVLQHSSGHIIPTQHEHMNHIKAFLSQFQ